MEVNAAVRTLTVVPNGTEPELSDGSIRFGLNFRPPYSREPSKSEPSKRMSAPVDLTHSARP